MISLFKHSPYAHKPSDWVNDEISRRQSQLVQSNDPIFIEFYKNRISTLRQELKIRGEYLPTADKQDGNPPPFYHPAPPFVSVNQN